MVVGVLGLRSLNLYGDRDDESLWDPDPEFDNATCRSLGQILSLTHLTLIGISNITDEGIEALASLTALTSLTVCSCLKVQPELCLLFRDSDRFGSISGGQRFGPHRI